MNAKVRKQLRQRKQKLLRRLSVEHGSWQSPMIRPANTKHELAERQQAVTCGGIAAIMQLVKTIGLRGSINHAANVFKLHLPYDEADHIFNIALNLLAGGTCLDHIEHRRNDEAYLDAVGATRIPDPTTAGDFCRRFSEQQLRMVMQGINDARRRVWKQQEESFFDVATMEADGTTVETYGEKKQGIRLNYKGQWGYHPLVITLAQTQEVLYLVNRSGNRPAASVPPADLQTQRRLVVDDARPRLDAAEMLTAQPTTKLKSGCFSTAAIAQPRKTTAVPNQSRLNAKPASRCAPTG